jgi:hypothetical protein
MAVTLRELVTKWGFDIDNKPLQELGKDIFLLKESLEFVKEVGKAAFDATFGLVKERGEWGKNLEETAEQLGINAQRLQAYDQLATQSGVQTERFRMALQRLKDSAFSVAYEGNKEMAEMFHYLGINVEDSNGELQDSEHLLLQLADAMKKHSKDTASSAFLSKILGTRLADLKPMLDLGGKAMEDYVNNLMRMGLITDEQGIKKLSEFDTKLKTLGYTWDQTKNKVAIELAPEMVKMMDQLMRWLTSAEGRQAIKEFAEAVKEIAEALADILQRMKGGLPILKEYHDLGLVVKGKKSLKQAMAENYPEQQPGYVPPPSLQTRAFALAGIRQSSFTMSQMFNLYVYEAKNPQATATQLAQEIGKLTTQGHRKAVRAAQQGSF